MKKNIFRRNKKGGFTVLEVIIVLAIIALFAAIIIPKVTHPSNNATGNVAGTAEQEAGIPQNAIWRAAPDHQGKFEVDSVPRGAIVKLLPPENVTNQEARVLGKTPLLIGRAECDKSRLLVEMNMADYLKEIEPLPELQDWIRRFKSDRYFSAGSYSPTTQEYFTFETSHSQQTSSASGELISIGPVYDFADTVPDSRICTLFLPRGIKREAFFPLMPPAGTYPALAGTWPEQLRNHYRLTVAQAACAMACMTRCGKYEVTVPDPYNKDEGKEFDFTIQLDGSISIMNMTLSRLIPGLNDKP